MLLPSLLRSLLFSTPSTGSHMVSDAMRTTLVSRLASGKKTLQMSGMASLFVALVAIFRLHALWTYGWLVIDGALLVARWMVIEAYDRRKVAREVSPYPWASLYAPFAMAACLTLGMGTMLCMISLDNPLATLCLMVTAGMLGGIASRNAILPRLALVMIFLGIAPLAVGAVFTPGGHYRILVLPLIIYVMTMAALVKAHYSNLVALMAAEQSNATLAARLDATLRHMPHGVCAVDETGRVIVANENAAKMFGADPLSLPLNVGLPEFIGNVSASLLQEPIRKELVARCEAWLTTADQSLDVSLGKGLHFQMTRSPVPDGSAVIIIEDISERRSIEAELLHRAQHDMLTGLPNRRYFNEHCARILRSTTGSLALMCLDLDGFKAINDRLGHHAGDEVLQIVASRMKENLPHTALLSRLGGDEFTVLIQYADDEIVGGHAEQMIAAVSSEFALRNESIVRLTLSVGIAFSRSGEALDALMMRADVALYAAKAAGKATYRFAKTG